jgi:hypothetical protein
LVGKFQKNIDVVVGCGRVLYVLGIYINPDEVAVGWKAA